MNRAIWFRSLTVVLLSLVCTMPTGCHKQEAAETSSSEALSKDESKLERIERLTVLQAGRGLTDGEREEVGRRIDELKNQMSESERKRFEDLLAEAEREEKAYWDELTKATCEFERIREDTPALDCDDFDDDYKDRSRIFGVELGVKVPDFKYANDADRFPLEGMRQVQRIKMPKPVKLFTHVDGCPDDRNGRIGFLEFKGAVPKGLSETEVDALVSKLERFVQAKYGVSCKAGEYCSDGRYSVRIDLRREEQSLGEYGVVPPHISLSISDNQVDKMDPDIPEPYRGDGFVADNGIKLPTGVALSEPESQGESRRMNYDGDRQLPLRLFEKTEGGLYSYEAWVNPGERGFVFIKAFELTKEIPLSAAELKHRTLKGIGYSDNAKEFFRTEGDITIFEGDWDQYYGARFELWFAPITGAPERKLIDRAFKIQGWTR